MAMGRLEEPDVKSAELFVPSALRPAGLKCETLGGFVNRFRGQSAVKPVLKPEMTNKVH